MSLRIRHLRPVNVSSHRQDPIPVLPVTGSIPSHKPHSHRDRVSRGRTARLTFSSLFPLNAVCTASQSQQSCTVAHFLSLDSLSQAPTSTLV